MAGREGGESSNYIARLSEWADAHLTLIRNISTGMAITGVILLAKSVKLTTKFTNVLEIPREFIEKNVKLRGRLYQITEHGLKIEHVPITLPVISALQRKSPEAKQSQPWLVLGWETTKEGLGRGRQMASRHCSSLALKNPVGISMGHTDGLLLVRLAGVELTPDGTVWLKKELKPSQMMWFQLLGRTDSMLDCLVVVNKGRFSSICLNEEILRQGLGRTVQIEGLTHESRIYWKLHKRLLQAELKAVKRNKGIWKEATFFEKLREHINNNKYMQKLKQFTTWLRIRL